MSVGYPLQTYPSITAHASPNRQKPCHIPHFGKKDRHTAPDSIKLTQKNKTELIDAELENLELLSPTHHLSGRFQPDSGLLKARAEYNVTGNPDVLNTYLPYRKKLVTGKSSETLKRYDQLVNEIRNQARFYEIDEPDKLKTQINDLYSLETKKDWFSRFKNKFADLILKPIFLFFAGIALWLMPGYSNSKLMEIIRKGPERGQKVADSRIQNLLKQQAKPLRDLSTRYIIAAGIADLLHQHPEYAQLVLKAKNKHPLRFILTKENPSRTAGQAKPGLNVLWLNHHAIWKEVEKKIHAAQHEFIHLTSETSGMDTLPMMSSTQRKRFIKAREELKRHYNDYERSFLLRGLSPIIFTSSGSTTGVRGYAFFNDMEFLAVTLDAFKETPEGLCTTKAGEEIYKIYKDIFSIDPLHEIKRPKSLFEEFFPDWEEELLKKSEKQAEVSHQKASN